MKRRKRKLLSQSSRRDPYRKRRLACKVKRRSWRRICGYHRRTDDPDAGIVVELKYTKNFDDMKMTCQKAIDQIRDRRYQEYLLNDDRKDIRLYGITFCKKRCCAISEKL